MKHNYFLRAPGNYDVDEASDQAATAVISIDEETGEEIHSLTNQSFKDEADINTIVKRFGLTGEMPTTLAVPLSGDFTGAMTFEESMNLIAQSNQQFMLLPADVRERFNNDPGRLIAFLEDDNNRDEALKLGLVNKPPEKVRTTLDAIDDLTKTLTTPQKT